LTGYEPRLGETFPLQGELDDRLAQLADIEADLARPEEVPEEVSEEVIGEVPEEMIEENRPVQAEAA
jgi:hypothetical protein